MTPEQEQLLLAYVKQVAAEMGLDLSTAITQENLNNALSLVRSPLLRSILGAYIK